MNCNRNIIKLAFALCVITMGVNLHVPLYAAYAYHDGYGLIATTIAFSCYVAGVLPVLLVLGGLSDRIGRRPVILTSIMLSALATILMLTSPHLTTLAIARLLLGIGTALMSATATVYMIELLDNQDSSVAANWVTASTSIGFGIGPALTSIFLFSNNSLSPYSFWLHLFCSALAFTFLWKMPQQAEYGMSNPMLRLPYFPKGAVWFGAAVLLSWATTGLIISVLPSVLAFHNLAHWSGISTLIAISCGLLFQPLARKFEPSYSTRIGLVILLPAYVLLAWGALQGVLLAVLFGALAASSACYGFVYLGGLGGVSKLAGDQKARASAGFFLMAYLGFSVPVMFTGLLADIYGRTTALLVFGVLLSISIVLVIRGLSGVTSKQNSTEGADSQILPFAVKS
ncbi:MAG TPA: MFS transporter [Legionella sp.]|nr:MFS transporter [Legionella sp.]